MSAEERPDDGDRIAEVLDAAENQTLGVGESGRTVSRTACDEWRERHGAGEPVQSIATGVRWHESTVSEHVHGGCPHEGTGEPLDAHHRSGPGIHDVPDGLLDQVASAIVTQFESSVGDTIYFSTAAFTRRHDIDARPQRVANAIAEIAETPRDGIDVTRTNPDANRSRWMASVDTAGVGR